MTAPLTECSFDHESVLWINHCQKDYPLSVLPYEALLLQAGALLAGCFLVVQVVRDGRWLFFIFFTFLSHE